MSLNWDLYYISCTIKEQFSQIIFPLGVCACVNEAEIVSEAAAVRLHHTQLKHKSFWEELLGFKATLGKCHFTSAVLP